MPKVEMSDERKQDAERLLRVFNEKKRELGLTQEKLATLCGYAHQAVVNNYLHGRIPLNIRAAILFARHLQVSVGEFSPAMQAEIDELAAFASGEPVQVDGTSGWPFAVSRALYDRLSDSDKLRVNSMFEGFVKTFADIEKPRKKSSRAA